MMLMIHLVSPHSLPSSPSSSSSSCDESSPPSPPEPLVLRRSLCNNLGKLPARLFDSLVYGIDLVFVPSTYKKVHRIPEWDDAVHVELGALYDNETWTIVPHPPPVPHIGIRWVYTIKVRPNGSIERHKAR
ncbi:unnamed protein product [Linum trigynum]|uniref:Mitochondrial protein n=1 Tax=Linum trigynum TaxID=586398 RepID=A0AAV2FDK5_9ROSI